MRSLCIIWRTIAICTHLLSCVFKELYEMACVICELCVSWDP
nr:MAG TPA: hypothetical protein [Caudoviricetes sp.]